jgi:hypothetical protein
MRQRQRQPGGADILRDNSNGGVIAGASQPTKTEFKYFTEILFPFSHYLPRNFVSFLSLSNEAWRTIMVYPQFW